MDELQSNFNSVASVTTRISSNYAKNFLEYSCFRTLALYTQVSGKAFQRFAFDMMLAWEAPSAASQPTLKVAKRTTGYEAFSRIALAIPIIANAVTCTDLFDVLTSSTGVLCHRREERILEMDGTLTTPPVLEHIGTATRPGRLILTDHALYFQALRVVTFDKPKVYELADDLKQSIKPELTGPWGFHLFDKAIMYKSISLLEPVIMREVLYAHRFIQKHAIEGVEKEETLSKVVLGCPTGASHSRLSFVSSCQTLLMFNLCDQFPGGDVILETLASMIASRRLDRTNQSSCGNGMYSLSALGILSNLGLVSQISIENKLLVGEIVVGEITSLERPVNDARINYEYGFFWHFYQVGKIEAVVKLTGSLSLGALQQGESRKYGTTTAPGLYASVHQHFFVARVDMDVDCKSNEVFNQVVEVMRDINPSSARHWIARNTRTVN